MKPTAQQPRFYKFRKYQVPQYIKDALDALKPPDDITVSQWAEQYRQLSRKESNLQGAWRNSVTPYLVGIMDEFNNWETERIVVVKPTQVGGTEVELNALGYLIDQDPAPTLIVYPNDEIAESTSANRIMSMLESPRLKRHFLKNASSKKELQFTTDMYIALTGAGSAADLSSKPIRYLFLDEVDKFKAATTQEADPISLSIERTKSYFSNRKIYICSTPTLKTGHIWKAKEACDIEKHFFVPCPHCGKYIELKFAQIRWPGKDEGLSEGDRAEAAQYICQECNGVITDHDKPKRRMAEHPPERPHRPQRCLLVQYPIQPLHSILGNRPGVYEVQGRPRQAAQLRQLLARRAVGGYEAQNQCRPRTGTPDGA